MDTRELSMDSTEGTKSGRRDGLKSTCLTKLTEVITERRLEILIKHKGRFFNTSLTESWLAQKLSFVA